MKSLRACASVLVMAIAVTACQQRPEPDPSLTAVGSGSGAGEDWLNGQAVDSAGAGALGLEGRDSAFGAGEGNQVRGLLPSVYFEFDQSIVRPQDRPALEQAAEYLSNNPSDRLLVEGHADWRGTTEYNLALGDRRAGSVREYLTGLGVPADRVETVSRGDLEAQTDAGESQMQQDRRADLIVVRPDGAAPAGARRRPRLPVRLKPLPRTCSTVRSREPLFL